MTVWVPSIAIWVIGIPIYGYIVLYRNRKELQSTELRVKYGFLYNGLKRKLYYWETVNIYRKIIIIFAALFLRSAGTEAQALVIFIILIVFLYLIIKVRPYAYEELNEMEVFSMFVCMLTVYCSLYYISDASSQSSNLGDSCPGAFRLSKGTKMFFFLVIVISNAAFIAYWCYKMIGEINITLRTKFTRIYLFV